MNGIGDHPDIARTLATGYPHPENGHPVLCAGCEKELYGEDEVFDWDGEKLCCDCCRDAIFENYSVSDIAKLVGLFVCEDVTEHYEYFREAVNFNKSDCCNLRL